MGEVRYRQLEQAELATVVDWAAAEGWEPGLHDADAFWAADAAGFLGLESNGALIGSGAIIAYPGAESTGAGSGFMGLFIVEPKYRGQGLGHDFWYYRRDLLRSRLGADAPIQMDGVVAMEPFYSRGGFRRLHYDIRMSGVVENMPNGTVDCVDARELTFDHLLTYDQECSGLVRRAFLEKWINAPESVSLAVIDGETIIGFGVLRKTVGKAKVGPLFADSRDVAQTLLGALAARFGGAPLSLDVPEINSAAMRLARDAGLSESFRCARMVYGPDPRVEWQQTFGVTTFEVG